MLLSSKAREGLRITAHSFVAVVRELLQHPQLKVKYLLSQRFNQGPLETFYGECQTGWREERQPKCENDGRGNRCSSLAGIFCVSQKQLIQYH